MRERVRDPPPAALLPVEHCNAPQPSLTLTVRLWFLVPGRSCSIWLNTGAFFSTDMLLPSAQSQVGPVWALVRIGLEI